MVIFYFPANLQKLCFPSAFTSIFYHSDDIHARCLPERFKTAKKLEIHADELNRMEPFDDVPLENEMTGDYNQEKTMKWQEKREIKR